MITYRNLGRFGRLGNALFELASTIGIGNSLGEQVMFPDNWLYKKYFSIPEQLFGNVPEEAVESTLRFKDLEYKSPLGNYEDSYVHQFLQDTEFFWHYIDVIRDYLRPSDLAMESVGQYELPPGRRLGVHVRRGDNIWDPGVPNKSDYHITPSYWYYQRGIEEIPHDSLVVISDDKEWVQAHFPGAVYGDGRAYCKEHEPDYGIGVPHDWIDLFLLAQCDAYVISGSTFGVWGAMLSGSNDIICPTDVYGPLGPPKDIERQLFRPEWKVRGI